METKKGAFYEPYGTHQMCPNNPGFQKAYLDRVDALMKTGLDGLMPDETEWLPAKTTICGCRHCREQFKTSYGYDPPEISDRKVWDNFDDPRWRAWIARNCGKASPRPCRRRRKMSGSCSKSGMVASAERATPLRVWHWMLLFAGGLAVASDRATFRAMRGTDEDRRRLLADLGNAHAWVLGGLAVIAMSGVLLFLSDVKTFATSPTYWTKMSLVVLLLANGALLQRTERRLRAQTPMTEPEASTKPLWSRLRFAAATSMTAVTRMVAAG